MLRAVCLIAAAAAGGLAALGQLSALWLPLDSLAHVTPQLLIVALMMLAAAGVPRWRVLLAAAAVPVAALVVGLSPWLLAPAGPPAVDLSRSVRVMTFNVWARNASPEEAAAAVLAADPDVVVLVELLPGLRPVLDRLVDRYPYRSLCPRPRCWLAVAAKQPFAVADHTGRAPMIAARFGPELSNLTVFGLHLTRPPAVAAQLRQVAGAAAVIAAAPGPVVAVGDFNATPFSAVTRAFARDSGLARVSALPSWPSFVGLPQVAIDHIFVSPGIGAGRVRLGGPGGSDHYPVIADLVLPPN